MDKLPDDPSEIPIGEALRILEAHGVVRILTEKEGLAKIRRFIAKLNSSKSRPT
jgi:hypothetical protein